MSMSKKDFIALADMLKGNKPNPENTQDGSPMREYVNGRLAEWELITKRLARFCADQNIQFKESRWLDYIAGKCGPSGGQVK